MGSGVGKLFSGEDALGLFLGLDGVGELGHVSGMLRVNGEVVDHELVMQSFDRIKAAEEQRIQGECCERDPEFLSQAQQEVADSVLIAQESERRFESIPEEEIAPLLKQMIEEYRNYGASWDFLEERREMMRYELSASLRMDKLVNELLGDDREVREEEVEAFFKEHEFDYVSPAEVRSLHLVKHVDPNENPMKLYAKMCELRKEALKGDASGEDFQKLIEEESEGATGEYGWLALEQPTNSFEVILFSLAEGEVSPVFMNGNSWHLVMVAERKEEVRTQREEVEDELRERILGQRRRLALQALAVKLREDAEIETE